MNQSQVNVAQVRENRHSTGPRLTRYFYAWLRSINARGGITLAKIYRNLPRFILLLMVALFSCFLDSLCPDRSARTISPSLAILTVKQSAGQQCLLNPCSQVAVSHSSCVPTCRLSLLYTHSASVASKWPSLSFRVVQAWRTSAHTAATVHKSVQQYKS